MLENCKKKIVLKVKTIKSIEIIKQIFWLAKKF